MNAVLAYQHLLDQIRLAFTQGVLDPTTRVVGIHSGGAWIAQRLCVDLERAAPFDRPGLLDISFYRDDFDQIGLHTQVKPTDIGFDINGAHILLVDDVLYTGRTVRAALHELYDYGRPASVQLAVLVDRGGRQLPFQPNYVGSPLQAQAHQSIVLSQLTDGQFHLSIEDNGDQ